MVTLRRKVLDKCWRIVYQLVYPIARQWWRVRGHPGVKVAVWCNGDVLAVLHSYKPGFRLPGGGLNYREEPHLAAIREVREEVGVQIALTQLHPVTTMRSPYGMVHLFEVHLDAQPAVTIDRREIMSATFMAADQVNESHPVVVQYLRDRLYSLAA